MIGTKLGPYEITAKLGEGGMGEVYRATDSKLKREVAIKVLPAAFIADPERLARFEREAQLLAQLHHPNIASIHGLEESNGTRALILELVEGEDLSSRIGRGTVALDEALPIARQIAEALEAAHEKGIVHRDLKPANIKLTADGTVKVLDFGLAKAMDPASGAVPSAADLARSPTLLSSPTVTSAAIGGGTRLGVILGTAAYMAPEQARGGAVDKRADIWAFGVVLYEMLTGRSLFTADTVSDTLAGVLRAEIDLDALPATSPPAIRRLLRRCLERNPKNRLHDIADARIELTDPEATVGETVIAVERRRSAIALLPWLVAVLAVGVSAWSWLGSRQAAPAAAPIVASILPPSGAGFFVDGGLAISPDGSSLVFSAGDETGLDRLWLQSLRDGSARPIAGTENGIHPFWSPDSRAFAFFDGEHLKRLDLGDGVVETFRDSTAIRPGGTWSRQGVIVFASDSGLYRVPAAGGEVRRLSTAGPISAEGTAEPEDGEALFPAFLPDGIHFVYLRRDYSAAESKCELRVGSLDGGPHKTLMRINSNAIYAPSGDLLWWQDGNLRAQPFDLERLELTGASRVLRGGVQFDPRVGLGAFSVADDGTIVYREGGVVSGDQLALVDRSGKDIGAVSARGNFYHPRLSPDGTLIAVDRSDETNRGDLWIFDVARGMGTRLTSHPEDESRPVWSPDGSRLAFFSMREVGQGAIHVRSVRGVDDERLLHALPRGSLNPTSWSTQGVIVAEHWKAEGQGRSIRLGFLSLADGTFESAAPSRFDEMNGSFSPDGRFLSFDSNETGRREVYVQPFPEATDRWRVSTDGGSGPFWRSDGRELFFMNGRSELAAVSVRFAPDGSSLSFGEPEPLFKLELKAFRTRQVDTIDGRTFVVNRAVGDVDATPLTLVLNGLSRGTR